MSHANVICGHSMDNNISVFLLDGHTVVLNALTAMFTQDGLRVIGTASDAQSCIKRVAECRPNILILDPQHESYDRDYDIIREMRYVSCETRIIVFSAREWIHSVASAFKSGASAYIYKSQDPHIISEAVRVVMQGNIYFLPGQAEKLAAYYAAGDSIAAGIRNLTARDRDIFKHLARGLDAQGTAALLSINEKTVMNRTAEISKRLGCNRNDFTRIALLYGIIQESDLVHDMMQISCGTHTHKD